MPMKQRFDRLLLGTAIVQCAVGLALLASASWLIATERYGRPGSYFFTWQAATAVVGLVLMVVAMHLRTRILLGRRLAWIGLGSSWLLLLAAFLQSPVAGTHRWLSLGGLSVQPSVLARLALVAVAAAELARARRLEWALDPLVKLGGAVMVTAALVVAEPDLGSAVLILMVVTGMAFVAGMPLRLLAAPGALAVAALLVAIAVSPYRLARVRAFLEPGAGTAAGWQSYQSLVALGSGGMLGSGYGVGRQKLFFLPEPHTDFVFSIAGEELGFLGVTALLGLAGMITWRGLRVAARQPGEHAALLGVGLVLAFALQTLIHMAVCLGLLPPKGIPLPLISYGKTDLVVSLASIGMLLNLSREVGA